MKYLIIILFIIILLYFVFFKNGKEKYEKIDNKKVFITFGGGGKNYVDAGKRLIQQVKETGFFDKHILYTDKELKDNQFWNKNRSFIESNRRGYGYWLWKPYIIMKEIEKLNDGDVILYADSGCEIGGENIKHIPRLFNKIKNRNHIVLSSTGLLEKTWTKMDIFNFFNKLDDYQLKNSIQVQSGVLLFSVNNTMRKFISQWYEIMSENYNLIDDSPSTIKNDSTFRENRHDQSILSLLLKTNNQITYDAYEDYLISHYGIHNIRNRIGKRTI